MFPKEAAPNTESLTPPFAPSQAPKTMKSIVMAAWLSTVAIGNLFVAAVGSIKLPSRAYEFFLFGAAMLVCSAIFGLLIQFYIYQTPADNAAKAIPTEPEAEQQDGNNDTSVVEDGETGKPSEVVI